MIDYAWYEEFQQSRRSIMHWIQTLPDSLDAGDITDTKKAIGAMKNELEYLEKLLNEYEEKQYGCR